MNTKRVCPFCTDREHTEFTIHESNGIVEYVCIHCGKIAFRGITLVDYRKVVTCAETISELSKALMNLVWAMEFITSDRHYDSGIHMMQKAEANLDLARRRLIEQR